MSVLAKKGVFTLPTTTQSVPVTGVGFQPKALILWTTGQTVSGYTSGVKLGFGMAASSTQRITTAIRSDDAQSPVVAIRRALSNACLLVSMTAGGTLEMYTDFTSFDADGFTLALTVASAGTAYKVHYLALGGNDITNVFVGKTAIGTSIGAWSVTGVGFKPDLVIGTHILNNIDAGAFSTSQFNLSAFTETTQSALSYRSQDAANPTNNINYQRNDKAIVGVSSSANTVGIEGTITTMDADGFTIDLTTAPSTVDWGFMAIKGGHYAVLSDTQKTSTGTKSKTGAGFKPSALLMCGVNAATSSSINSNQSKISIGGGDGSTEGASWASSVDNVATSDTNVAHVEDKVLRHATDPTTTDSEADLASLDNDGYTLDWTTADATDREFFVILFGNPVEAAPTDTFVQPFRQY